MVNILLIGPEIFLGILALIILIGEAALPNRNKTWIPISIAGLTLVLIYYGAFFVKGRMPGLSSFGIEPIQVHKLWIQYLPLFDMVSVDSLAIYFKLIILAAVIIIFWFSIEYREFSDVPMGLYSALVLFSTVGMMLLVGATDLLMAIVALELLSVSSFVLTGMVLKRRSSSEGAIKYFMVGSFSTALFLFGASYYYGYFGTTSITPLLMSGVHANASDGILTLSLLFLISGLGFKLAMVPFHMWAPDAYEGAPTPVTAFLSSAPKAAAVAFLLRLFGNHAGLGLTPVIATLACVTMTVGNIGALLQTNLKRFLAYSSIAQVGYILVAMVTIQVGESLGVQAVMMYTAIYLFMNLGVFAVVILVSNAAGSDEIDILAGLSKRSFGVSLAMVVFLLSMTGIPPMAGFIGKFSIFAAVIHIPSLLWLAIVAVLNSVISLYYYFRIAREIYFTDGNGAQPALQLSPAMISSLAVTLAVTLAVGIFPDQMIGWVRRILGS